MQVRVEPSLTMHEEPEHLWEVSCGEEAGKWRASVCECCVCTRASSGPITKNTEHWNPNCFSPLSQHLNANTLTNTMHYLKATMLDPTRSFSTA